MHVLLSIATSRLAMVVLEQVLKRAVEAVGGPAGLAEEISAIFRDLRKHPSKRPEALAAVGASVVEKLGDKPA